MSNYCSYSLRELHALLTKGELTSLELVEAALSRLEELNPILNALVLVNTENALNAAKQADSDISKGKIRGLLHGIPVTIKDNIEVKGLPTTAGFQPFRNNISEVDAEIVEQLKKAGAIIIGKTNLPALTYDLQTNNKLFGRTNNPWNIDHTPGGSSGGCAASVAARISILSFGNDSGGSIRIPAHFCGVYGFKASLDGISTNGIVTQLQKKAHPLSMRTLLSAGILGNSVEDVHAALNIIGTKKLLPPSKSPPSSSPIKLLWISELKGLEVDRAIKTAMTQLREKLAESGIRIDDYSEEQFDFNETLRLWGHLSNYETGKELPVIARYAGNLIMKPKYAKIPMYTDLLKPISREKYRRVRHRHEEVKQQFEKLMNEYDALILPTSSVLAFPHQSPDRSLGHLGIYTTPLNVNEKEIHYAIATQSYALPFNVLESPVLTLPIALSKKQLPIGVQLVGKKHRDFDLLELASQLDKLIPSIGAPEI
ncbi:MAG: amidase [Flavobacteriales bacterium]|nr:amidase [Flavobacteriales bacterium]